VHSVAAVGVVAVGTARLDLAALAESANVYGFLCGRRLRLRLDAAFGEQFSIQRVAYSAVDFSHVPLTDVRDNVVIDTVASVLRHRWLDRVLDTGQPLVERSGYLAFRGLDHASLVVISHRGAAFLPRLPLSRVATAVDLATLAGQRVGFDVEAVVPDIAPLVHVAFHAALSSFSMNSRSLAETTYTRRPSFLVGRSPALANR